MERIKMVNNQTIVNGRQNMTGIPFSRLPVVILSLLSPDYIIFMVVWLLLILLVVLISIGCIKYTGSRVRKRKQEDRVTIVPE